MSTEYVGFDSFPVSITVPTDDDEFDVASVDVPFEQLADRTQWCKARIDAITVGTEFTNITLHGTTTVADGEFIGNVDTFHIQSTGDVEFEAGNTFFVGAYTLHTNGTDVLIEAVNQTTITTPRLVGPHVVLEPPNLSIGEAGDTIDVAGDLIHVVGRTYLQGAFQLEAVTLPDADSNVDGSDAFEYICPVISAADRAVHLVGIAPKGWRVRFNAQLLTGPRAYVLAVGGRTWTLRNTNSATVAIEFVSDGTQWIVDEWCEGGSGIRNG